MESPNYLDVIMPPDPRREVVWKEICAYVQRYVPRHGTVLDLAAGYGHFINFIDCAKKLAVDINPRLPRLVDGDVVPIIASCLDLERAVQGRKVDVVFASHLLEHLERGEVETALEQIRRVLNPGGRLILMQPNYRYCADQYFDDWTHKTAIDHDSLAQVLRLHRFRVEVLKPRFLPYSMSSSLLPISAALVRLYLRFPVRPMAKQMFCVARVESAGSPES